MGARGRGVRGGWGGVLESSRCAAAAVQAGLSTLDYVRLEWIYYSFCQRCFVKCECEQERGAPPESGAGSVAQQKDKEQE